MPQQRGHNLNLVSGYEIYTGNDGKKWTRQAEGEFGNIKNNPILQTVTFEPVYARYIRFVAKSQANGQQHVSIAEIGVITK